MPFRFLLPLLALSFLLGACAGPRVSRARYPRVGVVALIPDRIETKYLGPWVHSNASTEAVVPGLQESVVTATSAALRENGYTPVALQLTPELMEAWTRPPFHYRSPSERPVIAAALQDLALAHRVDSLLLVIPQPRALRGEEGRELGLQGFGTLSERETHTQVYAYLSGRWVDAATLADLSHFSVRQVRQYGVRFQADFTKYRAAERTRLLAGMQAMYVQQARQSIRQLAAP